MEGSIDTVPREREGWSKAKAGVAHVAGVCNMEHEEASRCLIIIPSLSMPSIVCSVALTALGLSCDWCSAQPVPGFPNMHWARGNVEASNTSASLQGPTSGGERCYFCCARIVWVASVSCTVANSHHRREKTLPKSVVQIRDSESGLQTQNSGPSCGHAG